MSHQQSAAARCCRPRAASKRRARCAQPPARRQCTRRSSGLNARRRQLMAATGGCPPQRPQAADQPRCKQAPPAAKAPQPSALRVRVSAAPAVAHLHMWNSSYMYALRLSDTSCECTLRVCLQDVLRLLHSMRDAEEYVASGRGDQFKAVHATHISQTHSHTRQQSVL